MQERSTSGKKQAELLLIVLVAAIAIFGVMAVFGPGSYVAKKWDESQGYGQNSQQAPATGDYHSQARQDAINAGIDPDLYERQINQESGFNPSAVSPMGAQGIAQFMPSTAQGLGIDPWNASQALQGAANLMARYLKYYKTYQGALAAYNAGTGAVKSAADRCGSDWLSCMPTETQRYVAAITGA